MVLAFISPAQAQEPVYNIENITGDLYRFQSDDYYGVFLVTDEGIILVDPISTATAIWLKGELKKRFDKSVLVVIYSHHHADHISGGKVFEDSAQFYISHENTKTMIPPGGEITIPTTTFAKGTYVELGGKRVEMYYLYRTHTNNLMSIYFPQEKTLFLADAFFVKAIYPEDLKETFITSTLESLTFLSKKLDFEIAIPSHGDWGNRADFLAYQQFLTKLNAEVTNRMLEGKSLSEIKAEIQMPDYRDWSNYEEGISAGIEKIYNGYFQGDYFPIKKVNPKYPRLAHEKNICGTVLIEYDLKEDGTTENFRIVDSVPPKVFERASINAAKKYKYFTKSYVKSVQTRIYFALEGACHWEFN
ncbi:MAG: TonB family protein [Sphingomonadales bacterium]